MSGHSKWASIKHKKAAADAKRGKVFSKLAKEIIAASRDGGSNPETNLRLRTAIDSAKAENMPAANIEKAVKRGSGELEGMSYEEITYEAYGPGGAAILIHILTDNKNRTASEMRSIFSKKGGSIAGSGAVAWIFSKKGIISVDRGKVDEEQLFLLATEGGAEDFRAEDDVFEIVCTPEDLQNVKEQLQKNGIEWELASITFIPRNTVRVEGKEARQLLALMEELEDHDDVQNVYSNFDIADEILAQLAQ
jgi:YebC/PmpR family DNA-binding regulatory protein